MAANAELKAKLLELLESDTEFRYAVAAELGLLEMPERLERHEERMARLEESMEEHSRAIRSLQEQVKILQEQVRKHGENTNRHDRELRRFAAYPLHREALKQLCRGWQS